MGEGGRGEERLVIMTKSGFLLYRLSPIPVTEPGQHMSLAASKVHDMIYNVCLHYWVLILIQPTFSFSVNPPNLDFLVGVLNPHP